MLFHGILGYIDFIQVSRPKTRNLELAALFAKLSNVEETNQFDGDAISTPQPTDKKQIHSTPNDPPWNIWMAVGVWVFSVLAIVIIPSIFLLPYLLTLRGHVADNAQLVEFIKSDPTAVFLQIIGIMPAHIFTILIAWLVITRMRTFSFRQTLGWRSGGMAWWHYIAILFVFFALAALVGNYFPEQENDLIRMLRSSRSAVFIVAFMATFTAPLVEEVVYRGVLYSAFQRTLGIPIAVIIVTLLFAVVHVPQYYPSFSTIFLLTLLSLILTLVRVRTNNLLPCVILHTIFNGFQSMLLIFEPYLPKTVFSTEPSATILQLLK